MCGLDRGADDTDIVIEELDADDGPVASLCSRATWGAGDGVC